MCSPEISRERKRVASVKLDDDDDDDDLERSGPIDDINDFEEEKDDTAAAVLIRLPSIDLTTSKACLTTPKACARRSKRVGGFKVWSFDVDN